MVFFLVFVLVLFSKIQFSFQEQIPGCPSNCGNLSIPFPFGVKKGCYLNEYFFINCVNNSKPTIFNDTILSISITGEYRISLSVSIECYANGKISHTDLKSFLGYRFSNKTKIYVVGCDSVGTIYTESKDDFSTSCGSTCKRPEQVKSYNGTCSGMGCCQISIPKYNLDETVIISSPNKHKYISNLNNCSSVIFAEEGTYSFNYFDLSDMGMQRLSKLSFPTVIDWSIGDQTCEEAKKDLHSYACKSSRSFCDDSSSIMGYLCKCSYGFQGNPYLLNGCQDVDECADPKTNDCEMQKLCKNIPGSFRCECPKGFHGNGTEGGVGCEKNKGVWKKILIGLGVLMFATILLALAIHCKFKKWKILKGEQENFKRNGGLIFQQKLESSASSSSSITLKEFNVKELKRATNNYKETQVIGEGGFGTVYRGVLEDGTIVAIKKSISLESTGIEEFINEIIIVSQLNHRNVVKLLGCSLKSKVPILVYEFVPNGTLYDHLRDRAKATAMNWVTRLRIASEIAGVLSYMHFVVSTPIIHGDIKSKNILLDDNYSVKVSDFGISRLVPLGQNEVHTRPKGTVGYLDPEYFALGGLNDKSDVYSFGIVFLELLIGEMSISEERSGEDKSIVTYFQKAVENGSIEDKVAECVLIECDATILREITTLANKCVQMRGSSRPTMKEVHTFLDELLSCHPGMVGERSGVS